LPFAINFWHTRPAAVRKNLKIMLEKSPRRLYYQPSK